MCHRVEFEELGKLVHVVVIKRSRIIGAATQNCNIEEGHARSDLERGKVATLGKHVIEIAVEETPQGQEQDRETREPRKRFVDGLL